MRYIPLLLILFIAGGCMNIDYVGKKFHPTDGAVKVFASRNEIPENTYTIIGRFTVTAKLKTHAYEVEEEILKRAAEYGGDAIFLTGAKIARHGIYEHPDEEFGSAIPNSSTPSAREKELFGRQKAVPSTNIWAERQVFSYLLYKKSNDVNRLLGL